MIVVWDDGGNGGDDDKTTKYTGGNGGGGSGGPQRSSDDDEGSPNLLWCFLFSPPALCSQLGYIVHSFHHCRATLSGSLKVMKLEDVDLQW